jgi:16S rRNA (adenine1518-N6/adenine1519-N6)-dimethyltransferase
MELFDLVDINDNVIGTTDKPTAHTNKQLHRVVAVYVFNEAGELYVQIHKVGGGLYDHSVGGHVPKGEDYVTAAQREAEEELGIKQPLSFLSTFYSDEGAQLHMFGLFECIAEVNWEFSPNNEVEEIFPVKLAVIQRLMTKNPEKFTGGFINTMKEYSRIKKVQ